MAITNLTTEADLRAEAERWIERNGMPQWQAVDAAIKFSAAHGDPFSENPFRHALLAVAAEKRAVFTVGQRVTNSAGQRLVVVAVKGDLISVRFRSGIQAQVAASSLRW
jgi:hypothetical protein